MALTPAVLPLTALIDPLCPRKEDHMPEANLNGAGNAGDCILLALLCLAVGSACTAWAGAVDGLRLVPFPRQVERSPGEFRPDGEVAIFVGAQGPDAFAARRLREEMRSAGVEAPVRATLEPPSGAPHCIVVAGERPGRVEAVPPGEASGEQGYVLVVEPDRILIQSTGSAGLFYGVQTLRQLVRTGTRGGRIPCLTIRDWPALEWRGVLNDITRGPSPHLSTLKREIRLAAYTKQNFVTLYQEEQFAFEKHPDIGEKLCPTGLMTPEELRELSDYAKDYHVTVVASLNSFAHQGDILRLDDYRHLRETPTVLSPGLDETYEFLDDLYSSLIPCTDAPFFNVCCDEVGGLGSGPAEQMVEEYGVGGTYARHVLRLRRLVREKYGRRIMMWGDIILNHPDRLDLIPKDVVMLTWGYGARESFEDQIVPFADSGYEFFVCPGVSCWRWLPPAFLTANTNIRNFVRDGVKHGARGMINTMWRDAGENLFNLNWHGILWGAECAWGGARTSPADFNSRIGAVLFGQGGADFGRGMEILTDLVARYPQYSPRIRNFWNTGGLVLQGWSKPPYPVPERLYRRARENVADGMAKRMEQVRADRDAVRKRAREYLPRIRRARRLLEKAAAGGSANGDIAGYYVFAARRLELLARRDLKLVEVLESDGPEDRRGLYREIAGLFEESRDAYRRLWEAESKPFGLSWVLNRYDGAIEYYRGKAGGLRQSSAP